MFKKLLCTTCLLLLCACEINQSGDLPSADRMALVKDGVHTKEQVIRMLGAPSFETTTDDNIVVYARQMKRTRAFLNPREYERDVYVYRFNDQNVLQKTTHLTLDDAKFVWYDSDTTPAHKKELSAFKQLVKNFGRYDAGGHDSSERR